MQSLDKHPPSIDTIAPLIISSLRRRAPRAEEIRPGKRLGEHRPGPTSRQRLPGLRRPQEPATKRDSLFLGGTNTSSSRPLLRPEVKAGIPDQKLHR